VFLLVPAYPGSPGQRAVKWLLCVVVCYIVSKYVFTSLFNLCSRFYALQLLTTAVFL